MSLADWKIDSLNEGLSGQNNIRSLSQKKIKNESGTIVRKKSGYCPIFF